MFSGRGERMTASGGVVMTWKFKAQRMSYARDIEMVPRSFIDTESFLGRFVSGL